MQARSERSATVRFGLGKRVRLFNRAGLRSRRRLVRHVRAQYHHGRNRTKIEREYAGRRQVFGEIESEDIKRVFQLLFRDARRSISAPPLRAA